MSEAQVIQLMIETAVAATFVYGLISAYQTLTNRRTARLRADREARGPTFANRRGFAQNQRTGDTDN